MWNFTAYVKQLDYFQCVVNLKGVCIYIKTLCCTNHRIFFNVLYIIQGWRYQILACICVHDSLLIVTVKWWKHLSPILNKQEWRASFMHCYYNNCSLKFSGQLNFWWLRQFQFNKLFYGFLMVIDCLLYTSDAADE